MPDALDFSQQIDSRFSKAGEAQARRIESHKESVEFSSKVAEILHKEVEAFNKDAKSPIHINLLKRIYRSGASTYFVSDKSSTRSEWALARVLAFLNANKNKHGVDWELDVNVMAESIVGESEEVDLFDFGIAEEHISAAKQLLKDNDLEGVDFDSINDIYMDDDGIDASFLKNYI